MEPCRNMNPSYTQATNYHSNKVQGVVKIYKDFIKQQPVNKINALFLTNRADLSCCTGIKDTYDNSLSFAQTPEAYNDLEIELNVNNIQENFDKYGFLPLRAFGKEELVFSCGNLTPIDRNIYYIDNYGGNGSKYRAAHRHENADTIDPDILRNPTIVGGFYESQEQYENFGRSLEVLKEFFPSDQYKIVKLEGYCQWEFVMLFNVLHEEFTVEEFSEFIQPFHLINLSIIFHMLDKEVGQIVNSGFTILASEMSILLDKINDCLSKK